MNAIASILSQTGRTKQIAQAAASIVFLKDAPSASMNAEDLPVMTAFRRLWSDKDLGLIRAMGSFEID